jgi:hypothetical protein
MKLSKFAVATGLALAGLSAQAGPNLVVNGSFESMVGIAPLPAQNWAIYAKLEGWTGDKNIELRKSGVSGNASEGNKFVELDTNSNNSMFQDITASGVVKLTFDYMARVNTGATNGLTFSFGGAPISVLTNASGGSNPNAWQQYTGYFDFGSTLSTKTLRFTATSISDSYGASLDNVVVTAVPEPETYAMMLAGLGLMGTIVRRRKSKAA